MAMSRIVHWAAAWLIAVVLAADTRAPVVAQQPAEERADDAGDSRLAYLSGLRPYVSDSVTRSFGSTNERTKLVITAVTRDDLPVHRWRYGFPGAAYGCETSESGRIHYFSHVANRGTKGSGYPTIPADALEQLDKLLAHLPDDEANLPPANRRLILQVADGDSFNIRIYDRGNPPPAVLELLRISGSSIRTWVPEFKPVREWRSHEYTHRGALCLTPDGKQIIAPGSLGSLKLWNADTYELLQEVTVTGSYEIDAIAVRSDGWLAALQFGGQVGLFDTLTWQQARTLRPPRVPFKRLELSQPQFLAEGSIVLAESSEPALRAFDTLLGALVQFPLPPDAITYAPSRSGERAVYSDKSNSIVLWDPKLSRAVAKLDENARVDHVAFSPNESLVAVATVHRDSGEGPINRRIRVWRSGNATLVHELRPFEQLICRSVEGICWLPSGEYLLAATQSHSFFTSRGIGIWNIQSGRHRGELTGLGSRLTGLALLPDGRRLVAGCGDGSIRVWDLEEALTTIREFEATLGVP